mmetsp:Transcript_3940/g.8871  ORF Transcript_3940/g.8871 Transcript_3940/m.8871 type:complete len:154 (-) Transcript_3940:3776-4237(-)
MQKQECNEKKVSKAANSWSRHGRVASRGVACVCYEIHWEATIRPVIRFIRLLPLLPQRNTHARTHALRGSDRIERTVSSCRPRCRDATDRPRNEPTRRLCVFCSAPVHEIETRPPWLAVFVLVLVLMFEEIMIAARTCAPEGFRNKQASKPNN